MRFKALLLTTSLFITPLSTTHAVVDKNLPFPETDQPTAQEVANQVYFANHFYAYDNFSIGAKRSRSRKAILINRSESGNDSTIAIERHLNNKYDDGVINSRDLAIFHSGNLKGTGLLVTDYVDPDKSSSYAIWLPALRKIRRFAEPSQEDSWGGSVFTFGDVTLRKPTDETHELLGKKVMRSCLGVIPDLEGKSYRYVRKLPKRSCRHVGKEVYGLKSKSKFPEWWYDYRISMIDIKTFADYRTVYYKNGEIIKIIDRDWGVMDNETESNDPRALFWKYWYGVDLQTGQESWAVIPQRIIEFNRDVDNKFWSEQTLRKIKR
jgi:hypothetical protein